LVGPNNGGGEHLFEARARLEDKRQRDGGYGRAKHERRNDPLLSYIHHARNADEHGIKDITRVAKGEGKIRFHEI
jgi:hypothetical protein